MTTPQCFSWMFGSGPRHGVCRLAAGLALAALPALGAGAVSSPVPANGAFEKDADGDGVPDGWRTSGNTGVVQSLTRAPGRAGGYAAKLTCTAFVGGRPDSHAMLCQTGVVACRRGQWYRLSLWVKGEGIRHGMVRVALRNTRPWADSGIGGAFPVTRTWRRVERLCQASADVPAETSRFQVWFASTGTLWIDDLELVPVKVETELHPALSTDGVRNFIPNSSFECGASGWGSFDPYIRAWGNVFRLIGEVDRSVARDGQASLRIRVRKNGGPTFHFDYFNPVRRAVTCPVAVPRWWVPVLPGRRYVFSVWVRADRPRVPVLLLVHSGNGRHSSRRAEAGPEWSRQAYSFTARHPYIWVGAGPDLHDSALAEATIWLDAVQLERGAEAGAYTPRTPVESVLSTSVPANVFTVPDKGLALTLDLVNHSDQDREARGRLQVLDFQDREVFTREVRLPVPAGQRVSREFAGLFSGRTGYYRAKWRPTEAPRAPAVEVRCALMPPYTAADSPFGMNHAYPWSFMLDLAKQAGLTWMRDWSVKWQTVQPRSGLFDFSAPDAQIGRVLDRGLNALVLFPFPSTPWNTRADEEEIRKAASGKKHLIERYRVACAPRDQEAFVRYIDASVAHYGGKIDTYEIFNEPVYTTYALPQRFGYTVADYVDLLHTAYTSIKHRQPDATVIGGIASWVAGSSVRDFIEADGLRWVDVMNAHQYPNTIPPEVFAKDLQETLGMMRKRRQVRPIWVTEFGCYADDDPWRTPRSTIGDATMSRSNWATERAASEALVKTAAVYLGCGVQKVFFHAGTSGVINGKTGSGIFFEYGGAPRKMYAALAILAGKLGPAPEPLGFQQRSSGLRSSVFRIRSGGALAIVWTAAGQGHRLSLGSDVTCVDIMGAPLDGPAVACGTSPIYLVARDADSIVRVLAGARPSK